MPPSALPNHLISLVANRDTPETLVTDALEEWILHRRSKGDTLFEVSVGLAELESKSPPYLSRAFDRARYVANVPPPSDLSPPMGPFPLHRSASPATVLHHLLSQPTPSIEESREVILEYVLARELKLRDKKPGKGGKGTLGRDIFEDISKRLDEVEDGLKGIQPMSPRSAGPDSPRRKSLEELDRPRKLGLMLTLSLRMSLSYFTLQELATQLKLLALADAERMLVQHIRRRVSGEGRWGVGKELEIVESVVLPLRPALRPAFRSAKARAFLPLRPYYHIPLPAPTKSACTKLISSFAKDVELGGSSAAAAHASSSAPLTPTSLGFSPAGEKGYFMSRRSGHAPVSPLTSGSARENSPMTPISVLPPLLNPSSPSAPSSIPPLPPDPNPVANYAMELVSEYLTREKREWMLKSKWAQKGRDQLGKDLGEMEASLCLHGKNAASPLAPVLLPIFLLLRRTYALPPSPLPRAITDPYLDILPAPPDPDEVPFREPTVQTTTAQLYVNPRLDAAAAVVVLEELIEAEKEKAEAEGGSNDEIIKWTVGLVDQVAKRFPDGSYGDVFIAVKEQIALPPLPPKQLSPVPPSTSILKQPSLHRRAMSTAAVSTSPNPDAADNELLPTPPALLSRQHNRSASLPMRKGTFDESDLDSDSDVGIESHAMKMPPLRDLSPARTPEPRPELVTAGPPRLQAPPQLPPLSLETSPSNALDLLNPSETEVQRMSGTSSSGGWWDIVSAVDVDAPAPWHDNPVSTMHRRTSSSVAGTLLSANLPLPPGAEPAAAFDFSTPLYGELSQLDIVAESPITMRSTAPPTPLARESPTPARGNLDRAPPTPTRSRLDGEVMMMSGDASEQYPRSPPARRAQTMEPPRQQPQYSYHDEKLPSANPATLGNGLPTRPPPIPVNLPRPGSIPYNGRSFSAQLPPPTEIGESGNPTTRSKLGGFGRSVTLAIRRDKDKDRDKENDKGSPFGQAGKKGKVQNDPGKWNRDMVASIMGSPADRR